MDSSIMFALCQDSDGNIDEGFFAELSNNQPVIQNIRSNFFVPPEARELFSPQEIEERQLIAQQWFSKQQGICS